MDANKLAEIAFESLSLRHINDDDRGQILAVLQMALRTLEVQHAALLAEADEETAEAKKLWREALAELEKKQRELNVVMDRRDALENERTSFLRDEGPPGALSVALRDRDNAVLEMKAAQRAADEFKLQRSIVESELSRCRADLDMFKRLRDQYMAERDAYAAKLEAAQTQLSEHIANMAAGGGIQAALGKMTQERDGWKSEAEGLQKRIDALNAENARLHRSLEERMTVRIPGAVQVAKTEELHGMADVYAQSQRMKGNT